MLVNFKSQVRWLKCFTQRCRLKTTLTTDAWKILTIAAWAEAISWTKSIKTQQPLFRSQFKNWRIRVHRVLDSLKVRATKSCRRTLMSLKSAKFNPWSMKGNYTPRIATLICENRGLSSRNQETTIPFPCPPVQKLWERVWTNSVHPFNQLPK